MKIRAFLLLIAAALPGCGSDAPAPSALGVNAQSISTADAATAAAAAAPPAKLNLEIRNQFGVDPCSHSIHSVQYRITNNDSVAVDLATLSIRNYFDSEGIRIVNVGQWATLEGTGQFAEAFGSLSSGPSCSLDGRNAKQTFSIRFSSLSIPPGRRVLVQAQVDRFGHVPFDVGCNNFSRPGASTAFHNDKFYSLLQDSNLVCEHVSASSRDAQSGVDPCSGVSACPQPLPLTQPIPGSKADSILHALAADPGRAGNLQNLYGIAGSGPNAQASVFVKTRGGLGPLGSVLSKVYGVSGNIVAGTVRLNRVPTLSTHPHVIFAKAAPIAKASLDNSTEDIRAPMVSDCPAFGFNGSNVLVGVVDTGIDILHPDFATGTNTAVFKIWDQLLTPIAGETPGPGATGVVYNQTQIQSNVTAGTLTTVRSRDNHGHGTHVAGIAAGRGNVSAAHTGVAPGSELLIVKGSDLGSFNTALIPRAVNFVFSEAGLAGRPAVVNLSLGGQIGAHDTTDPLDQALDAEATSFPNNALVIAAGNDAANRIHTNATPAASTFGVGAVNTTGAQAGDGFIIDIWMDRGGAGTFATANVTSPFPMAFGFGNGTGPIPPAPYPGFYFVAPAFVSNRAAFQLSPWVFDPQNGHAHTQIIVQYTAAAPIGSSWTVGFTGITPAGGTRIDAWLVPFDGSGFNNGLPGGVFNAIVGAPNSDNTLGIPGTSRSAITVGSHITNCCGSSSSSVTGEISEFSSRGALRPHPGNATFPAGDLAIQKPDLSAPGEVITSARPTNLGGGLIGQNGTSMAAPHVAGAAALMLQANPAQSAAQIRAALRGSARRDSFTGGIAPFHDDTFGYGKLDAFSAVSAVAPNDDWPEVGLNKRRMPFLGGPSASSPSVNLKWRKPSLFNDTEASPVVFCDIVYGITETASPGTFQIEAMDPSGATRWTRSIGAQQFGGNEAITIDDGRLYYTHASPPYFGAPTDVIALNPLDGSLLWADTHAGGSTAKAGWSPLVHEGVVWSAAQFELLAHDKLTGALLTVVSLATPNFLVPLPASRGVIVSDPALGDLLVFPDYFKLLAVGADPARSEFGVLQWTASLFQNGNTNYSTHPSVISTHGGLIFVGQNYANPAHPTGTLSAFNTDGSLAWVKDLGSGFDYVFSAPVVDDTTGILYGTYGHLVQAGGDYHGFAMDLASQATLWDVSVPEPTSLGGSYAVSASAILVRDIVYFGLGSTLLAVRAGSSGGTVLGSFDVNAVAGGTFPRSAIQNPSFSGNTLYFYGRTQSFTSGPLDEAWLYALEP